MTVTIKKHHPLENNQQNWLSPQIDTCFACKYKLNQKLCSIKSLNLSHIV